MRKQLLDGLNAGQVTEAMDLATLPDHPAVQDGNTPATVDDLAKLLGIGPLPAPPPSVPARRNEANHAAPLAVQGQASHAGFFPFNKFSAVPLLIKATRESSNQSGGDDVKSG